jgi:hypothetical protein
MAATSALVFELFTSRKLALFERARRARLISHERELVGRIDDC